VVNLAVKIGKLRLKNPVMVASGTFGVEYDELVDINSIGAVITKTVTVKGRIGNPPPRIVETSSGMLNSIGLENKGLEDFINNKISLLNKIDTSVIVSIAGDDENEFKKLAMRLSKINRVDGLELNLSCPNIKYGLRGGLLAHDEKATYRVVKAVRGVTGLTVIAKLSPNVTDITKIAMSAAAAGADAVSLVNTFIAMSVDIEEKKPKLGNITGGLSGPAIKPIALRMVWEAHKELDIPIIGIGGIMDYKDALEFMICGATAIQVGTANFVNPKASTEVVEGIKKYLKNNKIEDVNKLIGKLKLG